MSNADERAAAARPRSAGRAPTLVEAVDGNGERILAFVLALVAALSLALIAFGTMVGQNDPSRMSARAGMLLVVLASFGVLRRSGALPAVRTFLFAGIAVLLLQGLLVSGVWTPVLMAIPGLLVISGWFLGRRQTFAMAGLAAAGVSAMGWLEHRGLLVPQDRSIFDSWSIHMVMLAGCSVIGVFMHRRFVAQLERTAAGADRLERELAARHRSEERMRSTLESTPHVAVQWYDREGRVRYWNRASEQLFGWSAREAIGCRLDELGILSAAQAEAFLAKLRDVELKGGSRGPDEYHASSRQGAPLWLSGTVFAIPGEDGEPCFVCVDVDVTERKQAEAVLQARNESLQLINQLSSRVYATRDVDSILQGTIETIAQFSRTPCVVAYLLEADQRHLRLVASHGFDEAYVRGAARLDGRRTWTGEALRARKPLVSRDVTREPRFSPVVRDLLAARGLRSGVVIPLFFRDAPLGAIALFHPPDALADSGPSEQETFEAIGKTLSMALANARHLRDLRHQARHDPLTGLPNRAALHEAFEALPERAAPDRGPAVMLLDLDRFKEINDTLGHHIGDLLLTAVAARLSQAASESSALTCRLGGDEFAVLLPQARGRDDAVAIARSVRQALARPFEVDGTSLQVGASIGVAVAPEHGGDSHALLRAADVAMYRAKTQSLGVCLYDRAIDQHSPERLALVADLARAVAGEGLVLHYQPKFDLRSGEVCGFEALVRWQHPTRGLLSPGEFMHLAEASELIHAFTRRVLDLAMRDKKRLRALGFRQPVALNLSARNLVDDRCVQDIERLIAAHGLDCREIEIELTETTLMHDPELVAQLLDRLDARGVGLAIDDFGTGYSSLAHLKRLPLDCLKVDQSFVRGMADGGHDAIIVQSTIALAHALGLKVVAEGVEDARTLERLAAMGCDMAQGYHLSRPLAFDALVRFLKEGQERPPRDAASGASVGSVGSGAEPARDAVRARAPQGVKV